MSTEAESNTLEEYLAENKNQITAEIDKILQDKLTNGVPFEFERYLPLFPFKDSTIGY